MRLKVPLNKGHLQEGVNHLVRCVGSFLTFSIIISRPLLLILGPCYKVHLLPTFLANVPLPFDGREQFSSLVGKMLASRNVFQLAPPAQTLAKSTVYKLLIKMHSTKMLSGPAILQFLPFFLFHCCVFDL